MADSDEDFVDDYYYYNGDEDEDDDDDGSLAGRFSRETYCGFRPSFLFSNPYTLPTPRFISQEEADRIGKELVEEEKREKEKANKKRLKKKRQKDRRRQQKLLETQEEKPSPEEQTDTSTKMMINNSPACSLVNAEDGLQEDSSVSGSEDNLDLGSTFVRQAQRKMENKPKTERKERTKEPSRDRVTEQCKERALNCSEERASKRTQERESRGVQDKVPNCSQDRVGESPAAATLLANKVNVLDQYKIKESMDLANIGNNMANNERFGDSLYFYTEAIKINPREYRFLGNRSYVYERLGWYKEALGDAETALELQPHFLKGHFRKGKALKGLKRFAEAMAAFQQVLVFDANHVEAAEEIAQCQQKVEEMRTCTRVQILSSAPLSPPAALPASSLPVHTNKVFMPRNIYNAKCDVTSSAASTTVITAATSSSTAPNAPAKPLAGATHSKLYPVWVGNITNKITEDILQSTFQVFGPIQSIRILYNRKCAFVNFSSKEQAEAAFCAIQGLNIGGVILKLQLRNPEHSNLNVGGASGKNTVT